MEATKPLDKWKHRRRIAYFSLGALLGLLLFLLVGTVLGSPGMFERLAAIEMLLSTLAIGLVGLVGGYMGIATMSDIKLSPKE